MEQILNGYMLGQWQRCKRPQLISKTHTLTKWRPQSLLSACLRHAIFNLSNGQALDKVAVTACNNFLSAAKNPGLDVYGIDTYTLSMDYLAIIRNVLEYLSRITLLTLREIPNQSLALNVWWQFLSHMDESGVLHRWKFVDYIDEDVLPELHSWEVFGDIAAAQAPMTLHLVSIGQRRGCHQNSPWCRIYAHPKLPNIHYFKKRKGELAGEWKPVWFSGNSNNSPKEWVDVMMRDNAVDEVIRHIQVKEVAKEHIALFDKDVLFEAAQMKEYDKSDPRDLPLSRYACDHPYACPHQLFCYNLKLTLDNAGIYTRKQRGEINVGVA